VNADSPAGKWLAKVRRAGPSDFPALMEELDALDQQLQNSQFREKATGLLLSLWITQDADGAAAFVAERIRGKVDLTSLSSQFGTILGEMDPAKVLAVFNGRHAAELGLFFETAVMRSMATAWPREYLAFEADSPAGSPEWRDQRSRAFAALAAVDPRAAVEAFTRLGSQAPAEMAALTKAWAERNPAEARAWVNSLESPGLRRAGHHAWLAALAKSDPQAALRELSGLDLGEWKPADGGWTPNPEAPDSRREVLTALAGQNLGSALEAWNLLADSEVLPKQGDGYKLPPDTEISQVIAKAAAARLPDDPASVVKAMEAMSGAGAGGDAAARERVTVLTNEILRLKSESWPLATTLEAARMLMLAPGSDSTSTKAVVERWLHRAVAENPELAGNFVKELTEARRSGAVAGLLSIPGLDPAFARNLALSVPAEDWSPAFGSILAAANPSESADLMASLPFNVRTSLAQSLFARDWARRDPFAASQWVAGLPPDSSSRSAAEGLAMAWGGYDETAASQWASSLPPGPVRDGAALGLASSVSELEPDSAWQWAASVSDPFLKAGAMCDVARAWGNEAPPEFRAAFDTALDQGGYPAAAKAEHLKSLDQPPAGKPLPPAGAGAGGGNGQSASSVTKSHATP
jgi:hypothetical protein